MVEDLDVRLARIGREHEARMRNIFLKGTRHPVYGELLDVLESIDPELAKPYRRKA